MSRVRIELPMDQIEAFCHKWKIRELALFGSVLRDDFRPDSDIDVLIVREPGTHWPWGGYAGMGEDLEQILGRKVDIVEKGAVEHSDNPFRKRHVLTNMEIVYAA